MWEPTFGAFEVIEQDVKEVVRKKVAVEISHEQAGKILSALDLDVIVNEALKETDPQLQIQVAKKEIEKQWSVVEGYLS